MSDNTNDTYVDEDAFGTPCLWLVSHPSGPELLLSKDDIRIAVNKHKPNAHWGAPSRNADVDRLWDAIAATAGEAAPPAEAVEADKAGLRERIESLCEQYEAYPDVMGAPLSEDLQQVNEDLREMLAAHPAEPAPVVTDEMVEAAAKAQYGLTEDDWSAMSDSARTSVLAGVRRSLEAALLPKEPTS